MPQEIPCTGSMLQEQLSFTTTFITKSRVFWIPGLFFLPPLAWEFAVTTVLQLKSDHCMVMNAAATPNPYLNDMA